MESSADGAYLDAGAVDWHRVRSAVFEVRQTLRYEYPGPITDLHHRLLLVPPDTFGSQRLLSYAVGSDPAARPRFGEDQFGNRLCDFALPALDGAITFSIVLRVQREASGRVPLRPDDAPGWYVHDSPLTDRSPDLNSVADRLRGASAGPVDLADAINGWVFAHLRYTAGATGVLTTALDALARGEGVCQDYTHVMIALCRAAGLPARYVSGHLLGEGAMHAWVQVILPDMAGGEPSWLDFDPTHGRRAVGPYVAVAAGRDYGDVSPTRGSFRAPYAGRLAWGHASTGLLELQTA
jgi:transglutaminase-like putative cysteine protease